MSFVKGTVVAALLESKAAVEKAMEDMNRALGDPAQKAAELRRVEQALAHPRLLTFLASENPRIRQIGEAQRLTLLGIKAELSEGEVK
jgi:hypothetical protein